MVGSTMIMVDFTNYGGFKEDISTMIIYGRIFCRSLP